MKKLLLVILEFAGSSVVHHRSIQDAGDGMILKWSAASYGLDLTDEPFNADCGALYRPFIRRTSPAIVYFTVVSACKSSRNLDLLCSGQ
jgi:hypothetical protein